MTMFAAVSLHDWRHLVRLPLLVLRSCAGSGSELSLKTVNVQRFAHQLASQSAGEYGDILTHVYDDARRDLAPILKDVIVLNDAAVITCARQSIATAARIFDESDYEAYIASVLTLLDSTATSPPVSTVTGRRTRQKQATMPRLAEKLRSTLHDSVPHDKFRR